MKPQPTNQQSRLVGQALNYLKHRARTRHEITVYLEKRTHDQELIVSVLNYLDELKLIDDAAFADWYITSRLKYKPRGPRLIKQELKHLGLPAEMITSKLEAISPNEYTQAAVKLLSQKARLFTKLPAYQARLKANQYLFQHGFEAATRETAIDDFWENG